MIRKGIHSVQICTNFKYQGWISSDAPELADKGLVFLHCTNNSDINWCSLYHEMGHIVNDHPFDVKGRLDGVREGVVIRYELEADNYVLRNMGREKTKFWLEYLQFKLTREIELREDHKKTVSLGTFVEKMLERFYLSRDEVRLRLKYL